MAIVYYIYIQLGVVQGEDMSRRGLCPHHTHHASLSFLVFIELLCWKIYHGHKTFKYGCYCCAKYVGSVKQTYGLHAYLLT